VVLALARLHTVSVACGWAATVAVTRHMTHETSEAVHTDDASMESSKMQGACHGQEHVDATTLGHAKSRCCEEPTEAVATCAAQEDQGNSSMHHGMDDSVMSSMGASRRVWMAGERTVPLPPGRYTYACMHIRSCTQVPMLSFVLSA
jgi:hypothetical protein